MSIRVWNCASNFVDFLKILCTPKFCLFSAYFAEVFCRLKSYFSSLNIKIWFVAKKLRKLPEKNILILPQNFCHLSLRRRLKLWWRQCLWRSPCLWRWLRLWWRLNYFELMELVDNPFVAISPDLSIAFRLWRGDKFRIKNVFEKVRISLISFVITCTKQTARS